MTRVRGTFWGLVVVAVLAAGALSRAIAARPGPAAALTLAGAAIVLALAAGLAIRIAVVVGRGSRR